METFAIVAVFTLIPIVGLITEILKWNRHHARQEAARDQSSTQPNPLP